MDRSVLKFSAFFLLLSSCTHKPSIEPVAANFSTEMVPYSSSERTPAATDLDWWSANEKQVQNAYCRQRLPVTSVEIKKYYDRIPKKPEEMGSFEIRGITLKNERPQLALALSKLLYPGSKYEVPSKVPENFQEKFHINPSCTKALCAAEMIFGKEVGPQMLFISDKFDINTSPYSFLNADTFNASEMRDVMRALELLPPGQVPFASNQKLIKFKRGFTLAIHSGRNVLADASIELFDGWSEESSLVRQYALYHEFAHNQSSNQFAEYDASKIWMSFSDWKEVKPGEFTSLRKKMMQGHPFVSKYGLTNPWEDFAESIMAYRLNPKLLKEKSEDKYRLIKLYVYDGLEYSSPSDCQRRPVISGVQEQIDKDKGGFNSAEVTNIKNLCRKNFYQSFLGNSPNEFFSACVNYEATLIWQKNNLDKFPGLVPQSLFDNRLRISNLKFKELRNRLANELAVESTDWLLKHASEYSNLYSNSQMNSDEYCQTWTSMRVEPYPNVAEGKWDIQGGFGTRDRYPLSGGLKGVCMDLVQGFTPSSKSTLQAIQSWMVSLKDPGQELKERGITREKVLRYILARTQSE